MRARRWQARGPAGVVDLEFVDVEVPAPGPGEVTLRVIAAGVNPADLKHAARASAYPWPLGYEVAAEVVAIGPDTVIASGPCAVGDPVMAFRVRGGFATALTVPAADVFARPATLPPIEAASLLLAATTAADMLDRIGAESDDVIAVLGASGSVGLAAVQLGVRLGARVLGVCGSGGAEAVRRAGGDVVPRDDRTFTVLAEAGVTAVLDTSGDDASIDAALALIADRRRIVTVAAPARAAADGFLALAGTNPDSTRFRDAVRADLISLAASGALRLPIAATHPLMDLPAALTTAHPRGKVVLVTT